MPSSSWSTACFLVSLLVITTASAAEPPEAMQHARASYELAKKDDLAGAAKEMRAAIKLAPENPLYFSALGGIAARQWKAGELAQARENIVTLADAQPANAKAQAMLEEISLELGADLARQRRFKSGVILAQDTATRFPASARSQQMLGLFLMRNQQNPAAVEAYRKALLLSPESSDLSVGLGISQTMAGLLPLAIKTLEAGIQKWPADAAHYQAYGVLLLRMAQEGSASEDEGIRMLRKALALDPSLSEAHYQLGNVAIGRGETNAAIEHLLNALRAGDQSSKVHFALSRAYRAGGDAGEAEKHASLFREQKQREQQAESKQ
jgi:tetratricopeptide (TPR) repeat protein